MKRGALTLCAVVSVVLASGCGGGGGDQGPSATLAAAPATERTTTSTTLSPEAEVEAAYLKSWDVYTEAVMTFDTSKLAEVYGGRALEIVVGDVKNLRADNTPARMRVEHSYQIEVADSIARIVDQYVNHSVLVDGSTHEPIEADPNKRVNYEYTLQETEGTWKVVDIVRP